MHLSWSPRAFLLKGFLSQEECDHLINKARACRTSHGTGLLCMDNMPAAVCDLFSLLFSILDSYRYSSQLSFTSQLSSPKADTPPALLPQAKPQMQKSMVVDSSTGKSKPSEVRTSTGTFFPMGYDDVVKRIDRRVAQVSMIPQGASGCG